MSEPETGDLKRRIAIGAIWSALGRWSVKSLGLVSTLILARLLAPEDFGLIAMATAVSATLVGMASLGLQSALISIRNLEKAHFDTAWTISVCLGVIVGMAVFLAAPVAGSYYGEPRVATMLSWMALGVFIGYAANPKLALLLKDLQFDRDFRLLLITKLLTVTVAIIAAVMLRDYRALVVAMVSRAVITVFVGYCFIPFRPSFCLTKRAEILSFSIWLNVRNFSTNAMMRLEQAVIGPIYGAQMLSFYYMGSELGRTLTGEIGMPLGRALLPGYAIASNSPTRLLRGLRMSYAAVLLILPLGFGIAALAAPLVNVLLGDKWAEAAPVLSLLAIAGAIRTIRSPFGPLFLATGKVKHIALILLCAAVLLVTAVYLIAPLGSLQLVACVQIAVMTVVLFAAMILARTVCDVRISEMLYMTLRVLAASVLMYWVSKQCLELGWPPLLTLAAGIPLGIATFYGALMLMWLVLGRPFGLEALTLQAVDMGLKRLRTTGGKGA